MISIPSILDPVALWLRGSCSDAALVDIYQSSSTRYRLIASTMLMPNGFGSSMWRKYILSITCTYTETCAGMNQTCRNPDLLHDCTCRSCSHLASCPDACLDFCLGRRLNSYLNFGLDYPCVDSLLEPSGAIAAQCTMHKMLGPAQNLSITMIHHEPRFHGNLDRILTSKPLAVHCSLCTVYYLPHAWPQLSCHILAPGTKAAALSHDALAAISE